LLTVYHPVPDVGLNGRWLSEGVCLDELSPTQGLEGKDLEMIEHMEQTE